MTHASTFLRLPLACALLAQSAGAQADSTRPAAGPAAAPPAPTIGPPIRRIETASALSKEKLGSIVNVRELPDGRVLLNDGGSRRLLLFDTALVLDRIVLDSASETENTYGVRQGALIPHRGDSTIFIDANSLAILIIDPAGKIARVRSVPRAQDTYAYGSNSTFYGTPGVDARGRLVYRIYVEPTPPAKAPPKGVPYFPEEPDSALIVALDLDTRKVDTLGSIHIPKSEYTVRVNPGGGGFSMYSNINPMQSQDEWAVLSDGTVAFVRAIDYRIDYRNADGTWTASPRIPYDWQPMPDSAKQHLVDSVRTAQSKQIRATWTTSLIRWVNTYSRKYPPNFTIPDGYEPPNGFVKTWNYPQPGVQFPEKYIYACAPGEEPEIAAPVDKKVDDKSAKVEAAISSGIVGPMPMIPGLPPGAPPGSTPSCIPQPIPNLAQVPNAPTMRQVVVVSPKLLPDFRPPFPANSVRSDLDGNLWIRANQAKPAPGGAIFDVVNRAGQLVDRIQLPTGYQLVGFGRGKVVFLAMRDGSGPHLARVRLR